MPMTAAWIDTVVRSVDSPFKQGSLGPLVGGTTQDRSMGLGGEVGRYPRMFAVRVRVRDAERGPVHETNAQVVRRADLAESLVPLVVLSGVQRALDRATPDPRTVGRGQRVRVGLRLWPYGGSAPVDRTVQVMVPDDFPPGPAFLVVGSGGGLNDPTPVQQKFQTLVGFQASPPGTA